MVSSTWFARLAPLAALVLCGCASAPSGGPTYGSPGQGVSAADNDGNTTQSGRSLYAEHCAACHQANGAGVPDTFPPLVGSEYVLGSKTRLIRVVLFGLEGTIEIEGETYDGKMPAHGGSMSDAEVARVLTYVRSSWDNHADEVTEKEVSEQRVARGDPPQKP